jgi:predicted transcriptional regulator of viral defense system
MLHFVLLPPRAVAQDAVLSFIDQKPDRVLDIQLDAPRIQALAIERLGRPINVRRAVDRLQKARRLHRLQAGRYVATARPSPSPRLIDLDPVADAVLRRLQIPYYVSWHSALWHYGLVDQQSRTVYVAVQSRKRPLRLGMQTVRFITMTSEAKFFGAQESSEFEWPVMVARPEKAIIDSLDKPHLAAPIPVVANALRDGYREGLIDPAQLVEDAIRFSSPHVNRRLGFFMDLFEVPGSDELALHLGRGYAVPLDPRDRYESHDRPAVDRKWRVYEDPAVIGTALQLK